MLLSNHSKSVSRVRRLSLMGNEDQESVEKLDLSHVRSLGSFGYHLEYLPSLAKLNALRVLDLCSCNGLRNYHLKYIGRLFQLRYLNISLTNITELPREIGDLEYLETLDASGAELNELPESVTRLKRLARLFVPKQTKFPDAVGNMENLQEFGYSINTFVQSVKFLEELGKLTNLRKLSIQWDTRELEEASCKGEKLVSSLCKMDECKLRNLHILLYLREGDGFVGHPSIPALNSIRSITLGCGRISWIAQWLISLTNLELLVVNGAEMEQQDVNMVGSIPTLLEFRLLINSTGLTINGGGFQQLQKLVFNVSTTELMFEVVALVTLASNTSLALIGSMSR